MELKKEVLENSGELIKKGVKMPEYDREALIEATMKAPRWVHFGVGNIFKAFLARVEQELLNSGDETTGIIVAEGYDGEIVDKIQRPHDDLTISVILKADGTTETTVVGSIVESLKMSDPKNFQRLEEIFSSESLQMASFTITEKGYSIRDKDGRVLPYIEADFHRHPNEAESYIGKIAALCYKRFQKGMYPIALVSMDNCAKNGEKLYSAVSAFAEQWREQDFVGGEFVNYINNREKVGFPWTMIDKITPRPDEAIGEMLEGIGFSGMKGIVTQKNTYVAPFVNAEETEYLVIEDWFPNGKIALDKGGVIFCDRETVNKVEAMKVSTCLNPLHTALAVFGCLLGYEKISDEMEDPLLVKLISQIGYIEGLPVVVDPEIISPKEFIDTVIQVRFPNRFMPDSPQRIATDTSQKLAVRFGETIGKYYNREGLSANDLVGIPLVLAGWCRYLMGINDNLESFSVSPDPLLEQLGGIVDGLVIGGENPTRELAAELLSNEKIFGVNLHTVGLADKVVGYLNEMLKGKNAVRETLEKHLG